MLHWFLENFSLDAETYIEVLCHPVREFLAKFFSVQLSFLRMIPQEANSIDGKCNLFVFEGKLFCLHSFVV